MPETPAAPDVEPGAPLDLKAQAARIRAARASGQPLPAGRLLGLPELPEGDMWADAAGAEAITGIAPSTFNKWIQRQGPKDHPFPQPVRLLYRLYWQVSALEDWAEGYQATKS